MSQFTRSTSDLKNRELLSIQALWLEFRFQGTTLSTGTGFIVCGAGDAAILVTARHNFTGRHHFTGKCLRADAGIPDSVAISHNRNGNYGQWVERVEPLFSLDGAPLWFEHPTRGRFADIAALKLTPFDPEVVAYPLPLEIEPAHQVLVGPAEIVSVIGFPLRIGVNGCFAVWATGFVASDPRLDYGGLPVFLIDCRSRKGQSGSPVVAYRSGGAFLEDGGASVSGDSLRRPLGVYTGRIKKKSDLGMVWKWEAVVELVNAIP
jgi:hypothetical protein